MIKKLLLTMLFLSAGKRIQEQKQADLVVFSYNRPLQLYAFLESLYKFTSGLGDVTVIYRTDDEYSCGYDELQQEFHNVHFWQQGAEPELDFKNLTLTATFETPNDYVFFAVDDMIVTEEIDLTRCTALLEQELAYGFYLRLGKNITYNYMERKSCRLPRGMEVEAEIFRWKFKDGTGPWGYPHTVDMTLFAKEDIKQTLSDLPFINPNTFEARWARLKPLKSDGLCFLHSKVVNIPINLVQDVFLHNNNMNLYSTKELQERFEAGLKIDVARLAGINNSSPHIDYEPEFIARHAT